MEDAPTGKPRPGIGFALFLIIAGSLLLAQKLGWLPQQADWFFPVLLIVWGVSELYRRTQA